MKILTGLYQAMLAVVLGVLVCVPAFARGVTNSGGSDISMVVIYGVVAVISLVLLLAYVFYLRRKERWLLILFISVFVTNLGYFLLAVSGTLEEAMLANRISYFGAVLLPLCMLMIILGLCGISPGKLVTGVLIGIAFLIFLLAASGGYLSLYYKEVSLEIVGGVVTLHKVYGPLHQVYYIYLFAYLAAMIAAITYATRKKESYLRGYAPIMCTIVLLNIAIWFVEQLIDWNFEFLSISYIASELLLLLVYDILADVADKRNTPVMDLSILCPSLTNRELDVLKLILENKKRKEIADELFVTENTVKKHTAHIYEKLEVSDRGELLLKLGKTVI